jgi:hypothetical protein
VIIKLILVAALGLAALMLIRGRRSALRLLMRRSLTMGAILVGIVAVIFPDLTTQVAKLVGVGRGTDLVLYLLCVAFLFVTVALYLRLNEMHDRYVELARRLALHEAQHDPTQQGVPLPDVRLGADAH